MAAKRYRLAQRRKSIGLTQEDLAEKLGVDPTTVRRWESGETETGPQPWVRPKLARCLQVSVEQLEELLHELGADGLSGDSSEVSGDTSGTDLDSAVDSSVNWREVEHLPSGLHDGSAEDATAGAEAQRQEALLATAYPEAQAHAEELRANTGSSPSPNGNGLALPTG